MILPTAFTRRSSKPGITTASKVIQPGLPASSPFTGLYGHGSSRVAVYRVSTYLGKPPTAQRTRIDAADRLFSVSLTRITSVPECAVSSVGFLWGSAAVSLSCGVSVGLAEALTGLADPARVPKSRRLRNSAPAEYG